LNALCGLKEGFVVDCERCVFEDADEYIDDVTWEVIFGHLLYE